MAADRSAFSEKPRSATSSSGVFTNATVGPCEGENSDFFPAGSGDTMSYGTCRPQLNAAGIATWLETTYCEDSALRPSVATEQTVYDAVMQLGAIFNVPEVAAQLVSEIKNDFAVAESMVESTGHALTAILLDGVGCSDDPNKLFVGAGQGSVNLILTSAGFTHLFADKPGSYACVEASEIIDANPDVLVIIEASWDSALNKIDHMHNSAAWCAAPFVKGADYIKIPFSASALSPRNGAAALDLAAAAIHVTTGAATMNFQSGVEFFDLSAGLPPARRPVAPRGTRAHCIPSPRPPSPWPPSAHPPSLSAPQTCWSTARKTSCARCSSTTSRTRQRKSRTAASRKPSHRLLSGW